MKLDNIGYYLRFFQFGNGWSDYDLSKKTGIEVIRLKLILSNPRRMTLNELIKLHMIFDLDLDVQLDQTFYRYPLLVIHGDQELTKNGYRGDRLNDRTRNFRS